MSCYKKSLYKSLKNLDELHEVMVDAYRSGVVLHYCLKCFTTFLTIEEREEHNETHEIRSNSVHYLSPNNPDKPVNEVQREKFGFQENNKGFNVRADHSNKITKCYICCKEFSSNEKNFCIYKSIWISM